MMIDLKKTKIDLDIFKTTNLDLVDFLKENDIVSIYIKDNTYHYLENENLKNIIKTYKEKD